MKEDILNNIEALAPGKGEFIGELQRSVFGSLKIVSPLGRNKNQTIETALKNWIAAHGEKDKTYLVITVISDLYQLRVRQVTEVELLKKL